MQHENPIISFVSPVYMAENFLDKLVAEIQKVMEVIDKPYEIVLVDDRSPDNSWEIMKKISHKSPEVKSIRLSRNFGQHPAIMAGLAQAKGDWIVVMDCDVQDQPKEVLNLYTKAMEGFDIVFAKRTLRRDGFFKKKFSKLFSIMFNYLAGIKIDNEVANFGIYNKKVVGSVLNMGDYIKSFPLFVHFSGFNSFSIEVEHASRESGVSSYSFSKLISLAFNAIISYSNKPLKIFVKFGLIISFLSIFVGVYNLFLYFEGEIKVSGYTSLIISIWLLSGMIITVIGIVGIYVGKVFEQTKNRPTYIIDKII